MSDYPPSFKGALFVDTNPDSKRNFSGKVTITPADAARLLGYINSGNAETTDEGEFLFYVSGYDKTSKNGNPYTFLSIQPPSKAFNAVAEDNVDLFGFGG